MKTLHCSYLTLFIVACAFSMSSCSDDNGEGLHYVAGTNYAYDASVRSTLYDTLTYKYLSPNKPQGRGEFIYNDNTFQFEVNSTNQITITKVIELNNTIAVLPAFVDGKKVYTLGTELFYCNKVVTVIVIPYTVFNLEKNCIVAASNANIYMSDKTGNINNNVNIKHLTIYKTE